MIHENEYEWNCFVICCRCTTLVHPKQCDMTTMMICAATLLEGCGKNRTRVIDTQMSFMDGEKESEIEKGCCNVYAVLAV